MHIEITKKVENNKKVYRFYINHNNSYLRIILETLTEYEKRTKVKQWSRLMSRGNDFSYDDIKQLLTDDVIKEVKDKLIKNIEQCNVEID